MKQLFKIAKRISLFILAISVFGCVNDDEALPIVEAGFTHTINADTGTVTFINTSTEVRNYLWTFGDGSTSTEINPVHTYVNGTYTITLKITNVAGGSSTFEDTITIFIKEIVSFPITFDNAIVDYDPTVFNGASFSIVDNPSLTGTNNTASKVGAITNIGAAYEGVFFELAEPVDLTSKKSISMKFKADAPTTVLLKLEEGTGADAEVTTSHTGTGWETILFSFNNSNKYSKITIFVDGPGSTAGTFYLDDIMQTETPAPPCTAEVLENINPANGDLNWTFKTNDLAHTIESFGNISTSIVTNPVYDGINTSCNVEKVVKTAGCETWSGLGKELATALDFTKTTTNKVFKMKVLAQTQVAGVTLRLERLPHPDTAPAIEKVASITQVGVWQELTFDFSDTSTGTYKSMIVYFERDASCDGDVYFLDDIMQVAGTGGSGGGACTADATQTLNATNLDITFKTDPGTITTRGAAVNKFFLEDATYEYVDNPGSDAVNGSCKVGKLTKKNVNSWDNIQMDFADKFVFTSGTNFTIKVYSPQAGYKVTLKFEDKTNAGATSGDIPSSTSTTKTNGWETLTIPIPEAHSGKYDKLVIFFDLATASTNTYYFDDLKLNLGTGGGGGTGTTSGIANNGDFETGTLDGWAVYKNGGIIIADNTENNGGTWSGKLVASAPSGLNPTLKQERKGAGTIKAGDKVQIKFDYKGSTAGGGIYSIQSFVEAANGVSQTTVFSVTPTANWQTFTQTYTVGSGDASGGITMEFTAICGGVAGCTSTLYLDNVSITINP